MNATHPRPRLRPKLSGRASSNLTEAFIPPSFVASLYVPESWNTSRSTAGAFVLTMFASNATLSAARASAVSTAPDEATAAPTLEVNTARGAVVVANRLAVNISTSRREGSTDESTGLPQEGEEDAARTVVR